MMTSVDTTSTSLDVQQPQNQPCGAASNPGHLDAKGLRYFYPLPDIPQRLGPEEVRDDDAVDGIMSIATTDVTLPADSTIREMCEGYIDLNKLSFYREDVAMFPAKPYIPNNHVVPESWNKEYFGYDEPPIYDRHRVDTLWPDQSHLPEQATAYCTIEGLEGTESEHRLPPRLRFFLAKEGINTITARDPVPYQYELRRPQAVRIAPQFLRQAKTEFELLPSLSDDHDPTFHTEEDYDAHWRALCNFLSGNGESLYNDEASHFGRLWESSSHEYRQSLIMEIAKGEFKRERELKEYEDYLRPQYEEFEALQRSIKQTMLQRVVSGVYELEDALQELNGSKYSGIEVPNERYVMNVLSDRAGTIYQQLLQTRGHSTSTDSANTSGHSTDYQRCGSSETSYSQPPAENTRHHSVAVNSSSSPSTPQLPEDVASEELGKVDISPSTTHSFKLSNRSSIIDCRASTLVSDFALEVAAYLSMELVLSALLLHHFPLHTLHFRQDCLRTVAALKKRNRER